ncbi:hypothetical protein [Fidelibacter multiformis]|jgi:hypothetical protein|uniref:hypothetical protein n=1 Tax=Fidelibacter multiformis TaxID=3377529 RepID=UPI0037DC412F
MRDKIGENIRDKDTEALRRELEEFKAEKEKIRQLVGQIGGTESVEKDRKINFIFLVIVGLLFAFDILRHIFKFADFLPSVLSLEIGLLLVSIKIVWMIHKQTKVEHFQFHVMNSIEFRLNDLSKQLREMQKEYRDYIKAKDFENK